jgi:hypothetical protein
VHVRDIALFAGDAALAADSRKWLADHGL